MSKKQLLRKNSARASGSRKRRLAVAITLALVFIVSVSLLAQVNSRRRSKGASGEVSEASLSAGSPSKEYIYAGGRLVATEEPASSGCSVTSVPAWTAVTTNSAGVMLGWTVPTGAALFDIQRTPVLGGTPNTIASSLAPPAGASTMTYQDFGIGSPIALNLDGSNSSSIKTYIYRIIAYDGLRTCSQTSSLNLATNISFGEAINGLSPGSQTVVKAYHLAELRVGVNAVWNAAALTPTTITWTNPAGVNPQTIATAKILGAHIDELRTKLDKSLNAINHDLVIPYSDPSPLATGATGLNVKAFHFNQLRQQIRGLIPN